MEGRNCKGREITVAIFNKKIKGMVITIVSELVIRRREFLKALSCDRRKVAGELGVLS
jgi:hypothetical protein